MINAFVITTMLGSRFADEAKDIRVALVTKVSSETISNQDTRQRIIADIAALPPTKHKIGIDEPYSRKNNPDTDCLNAVKAHLEDTPENNLEFQEFRTLYYQMMTPVVLRKKLPPENLQCEVTKNLIYSIMPGHLPKKFYIFIFSIQI